MLLQLIRSGFSMQMVAGVLSSVFVVFCTLPIHEFAHALIADKLGDPTARRNGRLTLNPFAHLDLWGCLMIVLVGFGYAKPVPVNMRNFKNPKAGMALVALAGPMSNLIMAILFLILRWVFWVNGSSDFAVILAYFFYYAAFINVSLAVFNLLPIPPLDGSRIATALIPNETYYKIMQYERYIMIGLFVLLLTGVLTRPLGALSGLVMDGLEKLTSLPFVR
jgi:Zn-dependent protease